jgi:hypothetical protein
MIRLFISHSSTDAAFAGSIVELLRLALNLPAESIRCTSVDGHRLPGGADTDDHLRRELREAEAFIGVVSSEGLQSLYVAFELGARWGVGKSLIPLLVPGTPMEALGGPLRGFNALRGDNAAQLHQLVSDIARVLSIRPESPPAYQPALDRALTVPRPVPVRTQLVPAITPAQGTEPVRRAARPGTSDTDPPTLVEFEILTQAVDVSRSPAVVEFRAHLVDHLSGVAGQGYTSSPTQVRFRSPSRQQIVTAVFSSDRHLESGTPQDGWYRSSVTIPQFAEAGHWQAEYFLLVDQCGNSVRLHAEELERLGFANSIAVGAP